MKLAVQPTTRTPIGVDVGSTSVKAVQLLRQGGRRQLAATAVMPRREKDGPLSPTEIDGFASVLYRRGFTSSDIVLGAPTSQLVSSVFPVPPVDSGAPREQIVRMELGRTHGCDPQQLEAASWELPSNSRASKKQATVMAVGCPHEAAAPVMDLFEDGGLSVQALDVEWMASIRAAASLMASSMGAETAPVVGMVDLGEQAARITVLWRSVVVYGRTLGEYGMAKLKEQLMNGFDLDSDDIDYVLRSAGISATSRNNDDVGDADAIDTERRQAGASGNDPFANVRVVMRKFFSGLIEELRMSLAYAEEEFNGEAAQVILVGGGAGVTGLDAFVEQCIDITATVASPMRLVDCANACHRGANDPSLVTAVGLAMYDGEGGEL